jgi:hypothetical protein
VARFSTIPNSSFWRIHSVDSVIPGSGWMLWFP